MTKQTLYQYLGTNGTILSPIHLEGIYYVKKINIFANEGKVLTKDGKKFVKSITVPEEELEQWYEVEGQK